MIIDDKEYIRYKKRLQYYYGDSERRSRYYVLIGIGAVLVACGVCTLALTLRSHYRGKSSSDVSTDSYSSSWSNSSLGVYKHAAVASDAHTNCSDIGVKILKQNGSAVDAAIAAMLCVGVVNLQSCGIGGGHVMTIYIKDKKNATAVIGRETAPAFASEDMYVEDRASSKFGGKAIGIPGEIRGLWEAHQRFGKLPWKTLFQPAIKMCLEGYPLAPDTANAIHGSAEIIKANFSELKDFLWNKETNNWFKEGEIIKNPRLAKTLQKIADNGVDEFYTGELANEIVADIQDAGGNITLEDLKNYRARVEPAVTMLTTDGYRGFSTPLPSSGAVYLYMLNILEGYNMTKANLQDTKSSVKTYHEIIEAMKFAYAVRSKMGDDMFLSNMTQLVKNITDVTYGMLTRELITPKTHGYKYYGPAFTIPEKTGTAHLSVLAPNGDAVAVTSTINLWFGSMVRGKRSGIIFNDQMDDFSTPNTTNYFGIPASPANFIKPGKRPMSSMSPVVLINDKNGVVKMVVGASGGSHITTSVAYVTAEALWLGRNIKSSIDYPRLHHQLIPDHIDVEKGFPKAIVKGLKARGHKIENVEIAGSRVQGILRNSNLIYANADYRKAGTVSGW